MYEILYYLNILLYCLYIFLCLEHYCELLMFYLYFWRQVILSASRQSCLFITIYFCGLLKKVLQSFVVKIGPGHISIKKVYKNWPNFFFHLNHILSTFEEGCLFCYLILFLLSHEIKSLSRGFQIFAMIFLYPRYNSSR